MWPTDANYYRVNIRVQMCAPDSTSTSLPHPHIQRRLVSLSRSSDTHTHIQTRLYNIRIFPFIQTGFNAFFSRKTTTKWSRYSLGCALRCSAQEVSLKAATS